MERTYTQEEIEELLNPRAAASDEMNERIADARLSLLLMNDGPGIIRQLLQQNQELLQRVKDAERVEQILKELLQADEDNTPAIDNENNGGFMGFVGDTWYVFIEGEKQYEGDSLLSALESLVKEKA